MNVWLLMTQEAFWISQAFSLMSRSTSHDYAHLWLDFSEHIQTYIHHVPYPSPSGSKVLAWLSMWSLNHPRWDPGCYLMLSYLLHSPIMSGTKAVCSPCITPSISMTGPLISLIWTTMGLLFLISIPIILYPWLLYHPSTHPPMHLPMDFLPNKLTQFLQCCRTYQFMVERPEPRNENICSNSETMPQEIGDFRKSFWPVHHLEVFAKLSRPWR